ncbi:MAG: heme exporter protein CcmD [Alphaproteobacteria bacterium]|nr:heme exporter protein CcmD [Alphaproteobacteria bacterium]
MDRIEAFLTMGGYGEFIWPAYAVAFAVLAALLAWSLRELRRNERTLRNLQPNGPDGRRE